MNLSYFKLLIISSFITILLPQAMAQSKKVIRAEIETTEDAKPFNILNLGNNGILIINKLNEYTDRKTLNWSFTYYNNSLQKRWAKKIPLSEDFLYQGFAFEQDSVYLFFYKENKKSTDPNLKIIAIEPLKSNYSIYDNLVIEKGKINTLQLYHTLAFFTVENKSNISLYISELSKRKIKEIQIDNSNLNVENLCIDTTNKLVYLLFKKEINKHEYSFLLKKFNLDGIELSSLEVKNSEANRILLTGMLTCLNDSAISITGSYALADGKPSVNTETNIIESSGIYFVKIENNIIQPIRFINFLEFDGINKYLSKREVSKIKKIQENKTQKEFSLNYLLLEHEVMKINNKLLFVAEAFYPEYRVISDMSYDYYGRMTPVSRTIFDGYRYTNAFILCLDENGNVKWNQLFDVWNILTMEIKERVSVMPLNNEFLFSYNDDGEVVYKLISDTSTNSDIDNLKIEMSYGNDKVMSNFSANIDYWYNNYYLVYGVQTIKNNSLANRSKRTVFYMNKVSFE
ncbi:MAG: hypothetical protein NTZ33_07295 [Bacteroidetes bacterium]|nr:hypothetical protein [Bacteroidota bacterium]